MCSLQHLSLHNQYFLQCWWWRRVGIVVVVIVVALIGTTIACVVHLMIVKRLEIEVKDIDTRFPTICIKV
jgi:phosphate/sulfate permease